jgi:hypothetical protein
MRDHFQPGLWQIENLAGLCQAQFLENWENNRIELVHKLLITPGFSLFLDTS